MQIPTILRLQHWRDWLADSVVNRVAATALTLTMLVALAIGAASFAAVNHLIRENIHAGVTTQADLLTQQLSAELTVILRGSADLSRQPLIANGLVDSIGRETYLAPFLRDYRVPVETPIDLVLTDFRGMLVASNRPRDLTSLREWPGTLEVLASGRPQARIARGPGRNRLLLLQPVIFPPTGRAEGLIALSLSLDELLLAHAGRLPENYHGELHAAGALVANGPHETSAERSIAVVRALALAPPLDRLGLSVTVQQEYGPAFALLKWVVFAYLAVALGTLAVVTVFARRLARRLIAPLRTLSETAADITLHGIVDARVPDAGRDEVGRLGAAFNAMIGKLREAQQTMEARIAERTEQLARTGERLTLALQGANDGIWDWNLETNAVYYSPRWKSMLGYAADELGDTLDTWKELIDPAERDTALLQVEAYLEGKTPTYEAEFRMRHKQGHWVDILARAQLALDAEGRPLSPRRMVGTHADISARKQAELQLRNSERRYRQILRTSMDGFWIADTAGRILDVNDAYCQLSGYSRDELLRMRIADVEAQETPEQTARHIEEIMKQGQIRFETRHRCKDGQVLDIEVSVEYRPDQESGPVFLRDITERKRAERELAALNAELEAKVASRTEELALALEMAAATDRLKSEFMHNVTHELRTPLNSVIGFAELLKEQVPGPLNAKQAAFAADILASGERLLALVNGILEMSRLDAAGAGLEREPVDIGAALGERVAAQRKAAEARSIAIDLHVAADAGNAELDPQALRRMVDALLDNAIKFNREGGMVAVSARRDDDWLEIAVADSGIGIARDDLKKLFQPLVQLDAGIARRQGGIGLGLALAHRLAELHGGTIEVVSEPGTGSTFTLRLPLQEKS